MATSVTVAAFTEIAEAEDTVSKLIDGPYYTPAGLHRGTGGFHRTNGGSGGSGGSSWGVKLNVTVLLPDVKMDAPILSRLCGSGCCCR